MTTTSLPSRATSKKRRTSLLAALTGAALLGSLVSGSASASPSARAGGEWQDGKSDSDTIYNCITETLSTGVSANVGWRSATNEVPKVGEVFTLRGYIGLVSVPCGDGSVQVLPDILVPPGIEFAEGPVVWDLTRAGQQQQLGTDDLVIDSVSSPNGGVLIGEADATAFDLRRGDILEFQFPVRATRVLKGPATQRPECQDRIDGKRPCPVSQSGDHFQVAFNVSGHTGDKDYVTPYVALFAADPTQPPKQQPGAVKASSQTAATFKVSSRKRGSVKVHVSSGRAVSGSVVVLDGKRTIARAALKPSDDGVVKVKLPKLRKGKHKLQVRYVGSDSVQASASAVRTVRVR